MHELNHQMKTSCKILGSDISLLELAEVVDVMKQAIDNGVKGYICVSNVHTVVMGWQDESYRQITNQAYLATPDGMPLVWASKLLQPKIHGRASGPDILDRFMNTDTSHKYRHFFFGSTPEVLRKMRASIEVKWPGTQIAGMFSPPFGQHSEQEIQSYVDLINESNADIVWVGLGAPRQEIWMSKFRSRLSPSLLIGVGAAFDFLAGNKARAPLWMQRFGLEWLFRLLSEPRRLFQRYAVTNTLFVYGLCIQVFKRYFLRS